MKVIKCDRCGKIDSGTFDRTFRSFEVFPVLYGEDKNGLKINLCYDCLKYLVKFVNEYEK